VGANELMRCWIGSLAHRRDAEFAVQPTAVFSCFFGNNQLCKIHRDEDPNHMPHLQIMGPFCSRVAAGWHGGVTLSQGKPTLQMPKLVPVPSSFQVVMILVELLTSRAAGDFQDVRNSWLALHY